MCHTFIYLEYFHWSYLLYINFDLKQTNQSLLFFIMDYRNFKSTSNELLEYTKSNNCLFIVHTSAKTRRHS